MKKILLTMAAFAAMTASAEVLRDKDDLPPSDGWSVMGLALMPVDYMQFPGRNGDVAGLGLNVFCNHNRTVNGLMLGSFGNWAEGELNGLMLAGFANCANSSDFGIHFAALVNYCEQEFSGVQFALVNSTMEMHGFQAGLVNAISDGGGVQLGVWNMAENFSGFQMGLINLAHEYSGIQIGLANIIAESPLGACVFMNAHF